MKNYVWLFGFIGVLLTSCGEELTVDAPSLPEPIVKEIQNGDELDQLYFNDKGQLVRVATSYLSQAVVEDKFNYDLDGRLISREQYNPAENVPSKFEMKRVLFEYGYDGEQIAQVNIYDFDGDGNKVFLQAFKNLSWEGDYLLRLEVFLPAAGAEGRPLYSVEYTYQDGNQTSSTIFILDEDGQNASMNSQVKYVFDNAENPLKGTNYGGVFNQWSFSKNNCIGITDRQTKTERVLNIVNGFPLAFTEKEYTLEGTLLGETEGSYRYDYQ